MFMTQSVTVDVHTDSRAAKGFGADHMLNRLHPALVAIKCCCACMHVQRRLS